MTKIAYFKTSHTSHWESLKISFPLIFDLYKSQGFHAIEMDTKYPEKIEEYEELIFVNHKPHPLEFFKKNRSDDQNKTFIFHIYGDFFLYIDKWKELFQLLKGRKVCIITCSLTHQKFLKNMIKGARFQILPHLVPDYFFSNNSTTIYYDFIFCGRVTSQKNTENLLRAYIELKKDFGKLKLGIVGAIDDIGHHYQGKEHLCDKNFISRLNKYRTLCPEVEFLGGKSFKDIPDILRKSRFLINPSSFHEEDFGRIVPEAMACGCYPVLSYWGGHKDFIEKFNLYCEMKTEVDNEGVRKVSWQSLYEAMKWHMEKEFKRTEMMKLSKEAYSLKSFKDKRITFESDELAGTTDLFDQCVSAFKIHFGPVFKDHNLYRKVYECYQ